MFNDVMLLLAVTVIAFSVYDISQTQKKLAATLEALVQIHNIRVFQGTQDLTDDSIGD